MRAIKKALIDCKGSIIATSKKIDVDRRTITNYIHYFPELEDFVSEQSRISRELLRERKPWPKLRSYNQPYDDDD